MSQSVFTLPIRRRLIEIASRDIGQLETSRNQGPAIKKFWSATSYPDGYANREPYCAAAVCYWVQQWLRIPEVVQSFVASGKSPVVKEATALWLEKWRCKSARAFDWIDWARKNKLKCINIDRLDHETLLMGDIVVFDFSHIGIFVMDTKTRMTTIEANTSSGESGSQSDGQGIFQRNRPKEVAKFVIRLWE